MRKYAIILAAGKGTRMRTDIPKCIMNFHDKPIIEYIVSNCEKCEFDEILVVVGHQKEKVMNLLGDRVEYIIQEEQLGTAHAVKSCKKYLNNKDGICVIIPGDMLLYDYRIINKLMKVHLMTRSSLTIVSTIIDEPKEYGRVYREDGYIKKIVEYKDANEDQKIIKEINSGLYCANINELFIEIENVSNQNSSKEYYFTDLIEIFEKKYKIGCYFVMDSKQLISVNDLESLKAAEELIKKK